MLYSIGDRNVETKGEYFVAPSATVVGSVVIGHRASVWFNAVVRGDNDSITLGDEVNIQDAAVLHVDEGAPVVLERRVSVAHKAMLHGCTVREGSLIGINAVVLNHTVVGRECLIGANALVAEGKRIPDRSLVLGAPGRVVRTLTDVDLEEMAKITDHYVEQAARYREALRRIE